MCKPRPSLFTLGPILFPFPFLFSRVDGFSVAPMSYCHSRGAGEKKFTVICFLLSLEILFFLFSPHQRKNVFCSWGGFRQPLHRLLSLPSPPSRKAGWLWGLLLVAVLRVYVVLADGWANGLSWVVSMKVSHNLILKWKPWVKLLSLFHQAHQGLPFPLWKLYFMQCISNPSVTSISDPV